MKKILVIACLALSLASCKELGTILSTMGQQGAPTEGEVAAGLVESLVIGMTKGSEQLSVTDGFFKNELIRIPFPQEAQHVSAALTKLGAGQLVNDTTLSLNRAAEDASGIAKDVLITAIKSMTVTDAMDILLGPDNAATTYLKQTTSETLLSKFSPIISNSLNGVNATKYWGDVTSKYNQYNQFGILGKPINTDLTNYVATKALDGLFTVVETEEKNIRANPRDRATTLLQKVFGFADTQKQTQ